MNKSSLPILDLSPSFVEAAKASKAWPFEEARKLVKRAEKRGADQPVLFETGYGPSGLPHIGTFGEVARTTMVRTAFRLLTEDRIETRLLCFSDDMDGLRKVPDNVPNREMMAGYIGQPLTRVPDPFGSEHGSVRRGEQCQASRFSGPFRLCLRVRQRDRLLHLRPFRRSAREDA